MHNSGLISMFEHKRKLVNNVSDSLALNEMNDKYEWMNKYVNASYFCVDK